MQRLRLKADGRIVELRDGQEFPLAPVLPGPSLALPAASSRVSRPSGSIASWGFEMWPPRSPVCTSPAPGSQPSLDRGGAPER